MTTGNIMTDGGTMTLSFVTLINNLVILSASKGDWHRHGSTSNVILSASKGAWFDWLTMKLSFVTPSLSRGDASTSSA